MASRRRTSASTADPRARPTTRRQRSALETRRDQSRKSPGAGGNRLDRYRVAFYTSSRPDREFYSIFVTGTDEEDAIRAAERKTGKKIGYFYVLGWPSPQVTRE